MQVHSLPLSGSSKSTLSSLQSLGVGERRISDTASARRSSLDLKWL